LLIGAAAASASVPGTSGAFPAFAIVELSPEEGPGGVACG